MGKVLLIEPQKILRQAISLSLFPQHEVQVEEGFGASQLGSLKDYDLLIVDGAALRESKQLTAEVTRAIQGCKTPTLWLEDDATSHAPRRERLTIVKKPIEREPFQSVVDAFLSPETSPKRRVTSSAVASARAETHSREAKKKPAAPSQQGSFQFIDLVDVVEEKPSPRQGKKSTRKST